MGWPAAVWVVQGCAPLKIVESMGSGVAVVASDLAPVREVITHRENGWLVHPERLARALRILLDHPTLVRELGANARETIARKFTWDAALTALRSLYGQLKMGRRNAEGVACLEGAH